MQASGTAVPIGAGTPAVVIGDRDDMGLSVDDAIAVIDGDAEFSEVSDVTKRALAAKLLGEAAKRQRKGPY